MVYTVKNQLKLIKSKQVIYLYLWKPNYDLMIMLCARKLYLGDIIIERKKLN